MSKHVYTKLDLTVCGGRALKQRRKDQLKGWLRPARETHVAAEVRLHYVKAAIVAVMHVHCKYEEDIFRAKSYICDTITQRGTLT